MNDQRATILKWVVSPQMRNKEGQILRTKDRQGASRVLLRSSKTLEKMILQMARESTRKASMDSHVARAAGCCGLQGAVGSANPQTGCTKNEMINTK